MIQIWQRPWHLPCIFTDDDYGRCAAILKCNCNYRYCLSYINEKYPIETTNAYDELLSAIYE